MQAQHYRAIFISDVHLGTSACQANYLLDFLKQNTADTYYLVGDIIDLMAMKKRVQFTAQNEEVIGCLLKKAKAGASIVYIPGNHDAFFRRFAGQQIAGVDVKLHAIHESRNGQRFYVSHGDEFDAIMQCGSWLNIIGDVSHGVLLRLNTFVNFVRRSWNLPYWSLARSVKKRIGKAQAFIDKFEQVSSHRAGEREFDGYICGHIHHWQMKYHGETLYINDGDWVEHCTALVETIQGDMQLLHWADDKEILMRSSALELPNPLQAPDAAWLTRDASSVSSLKSNV